MEQDMMPADEGARRVWLKEAGVHRIAAALNRAEKRVGCASFDMIPKDKARRVFSLLEPPTQQGILASLDVASRARLVDEMEPDDRARLIARLPEGEGAGLLKLMDPDEREMTERLLGYPDESAGRIMTPEFVPLRPDMTVSEALDAVREGERSAETIHFMPVIDADGRLVGTISLPALVLAEPEETIGDLATRDVPAVRVDEDQEDVARLMKEADLMGVPVVDADDRLVGIITFDDAMEVLEFEETEDIARTGAAEPLARPYLSVSILRLVRSRIIWLCLLAVAATLTVNVLSAFESTLDQVVSLALFIPLLIGIGGNAGAQSATTVVRALAVRDVTPGDAGKVALKELQAATLMGVALALVGFVVVTVFFDRDIALIVSTTMVVVCALGALVGAMMPLVAKLVSVDPAVFSAPFVTTIVDASGLLIYFFIAKTVLDL